jgi:hypothetical protein
MLNVSPSPALLVEDAFWPLLVVQFQGTLPLTRFEEYLEQRLSYLQREEKHVIIFDMRHAPMLSSELRQRQSEWLKQYSHLLDSKVLGHALVITSPLLRLMISTFHKVRPRNGPHIVTPHLNDAARWSLNILKEAGLQPPTGRIEAHFGLSPDSR